MSDHVLKNLKEKIKIPKGNPFENDKLGREKIADDLSSIIRSYCSPLVLSVNGSWGFGKTTFIEMWKMKLQDEGHPCIYFNAWENDFSENPLISFMGEIQEFVESKQKENKGNKEWKTINKNWLQVKKVGLTVFKKLIPVIVRVLSQGLVDAGKIEEISKITKELPKILENVAEEKIKEYQEEKNTLQEFRDNFETFAKGLTIGGSTSFSRPLIIFVDELDRCKPTYAVELLETIKHFFSVHYVVFVLGINRQELSHSVRGLYGSEMDADEYLKKFINHEFTLPDPSRKNYCEYLLDFFKMNEIFDSRATASMDLGKRDRFNYILFSLVELLKLDLRTIGQIFSRLNIAIRQSVSENDMFPECLAALTVIKSVDEKVYKKLLNRESNSKILDPLKIRINNSDFLNSKEWQIFDIFVNCLGMSEEEISNQIDTLTLEDRRLHIFRAFKNIEDSHHNVFSKIEFCDQFK